MEFNKFSNNNEKVLVKQLTVFKEFIIFGTDRYIINEKSYLSELKRLVSDIEQCEYRIFITNNTGWVKYINKPIFIYLKESGIDMSILCTALGKLNNYDTTNRLSDSRAETAQCDLSKAYFNKGHTAMKWQIKHYETFRSAYRVILENYKKECDIDVETFYHDLYTVIMTDNRLYIDTLNKLIRIKEDKPKPIIEFLDSSKYYCIKLPCFWFTSRFKLKINELDYIKLLTDTDIDIMARYKLDRRMERVILSNDLKRLNKMSTEDKQEAVNAKYEILDDLQSLDGCAVLEFGNSITVMFDSSVPVKTAIEHIINSTVNYMCLFETMLISDKYTSGGLWKRFELADSHVAKINWVTGYEKLSEPSTEPFRQLKEIVKLSQNKLPLKDKYLSILGRVYELFEEDEFTKGKLNISLDNENNHVIRVSAKDKNDETFMWIRLEGTDKLTLNVSSVIIDEAYRRKGVFTRFINEIGRHAFVERIVIGSIITEEMLSWCNRRSDKQLNICDSYIEETI